VIDGFRVVDTHVHAPVLADSTQTWVDWADEFSGPEEWRAAFDADGRPEPAALDGLLAAQGVDAALLFCEYSPRSAGLQRFDDLLPIVAHNPERFRPVANVNPHLHWPATAELERQLGLGAVALKLHPVHGAFHLHDPDLAGVYAVCAERGIPVIVHTGSSTFPGSRSTYGNPEHLVDVVERHRDLTVVLAHGGRGWYYDSAAYLALAKPNVWLDLAGLPPRKLGEYYQRFDLRRLAGKWLFATDWPGVPGTARNVRTLVASARAEWGWDDELIARVLSGNAHTVFGV
jgi:predicted TIM-barrel fold metal-dependent hydrolase